MIRVSGWDSPRLAVVRCPTATAPLILGSDFGEMRMEREDTKCARALASRLMPSCLCAVDTAGNRPGQNKAVRSINLERTQFLHGTAQRSSTSPHVGPQIADIFNTCGHVLK
jgi:hypothetical protein